VSLAAPLPVFLRSTQPVRGRAVSGTGTDAGVSSATPDARITVVRQSENDVGFREIFVSLDGQSIGILRHGETLTTDVPSGPHRIRAHNTLFWKTHDIVLKPGEHARFVAINKAGWGTFGMLFVLGAMPVYLSFERVPAQVFSNSADR
jgi:hypothetical protein